MEKKSAGEPSRYSWSTLNWNEVVDDLLSSGTDAAIFLLESEISELELEANPPSPAADLRLAVALTDLANLYSSAGSSSNSDELRSRAAALKRRALGSVGDEQQDSSSNPAFSSSSRRDGGSGLSFPPDRLPSVSKDSEQDDAVPNRIRRGRGTFQYGSQNRMYSDRPSDVDELVPDGEEEDDEQVIDRGLRSRESRNARYGTRHALVLADLPLTTKQSHLERLVDGFSDRGVSIVLVNETNALAVFTTPSAALEAFNSIRFPFPVRILNEDDTLMSFISPTDLEPPRQRPQTSAATANRMIAQATGLDLPSSGSGSGSREVKEQKEARKYRILTKEKQKDGAWGDDD